MSFLREPQLFQHIAGNRLHHGHLDAWWETANSRLLSEREFISAELQNGQLEIGPLGVVPFTLVDMGSISSVDLFGLDELIIFSFYWVNRGRYRQVIDLGANVGLHSVILAALGYSVVAFEPDPNHVSLLAAHLKSAALDEKVTVRQAAVAEQAGSREFIRVLGNTTGSHLAGSKPNPYGELETIQVQAVSIRDAVLGADLIKMDVEGMEADLLTNLSVPDFEKMDIICEVGSSVNAVRIWEHFRDSDVHMFCQKVGWRRADGRSDLPTSHQEGSLFLSSRSEMPWSAEDQNP